MSSNRRAQLEVITSTLLDPPYSVDVRARGWRFELDVERVTQSDTWMLATPDMRPWLLMLWMTAWQQSPCGSLPADDALIAAHIGMERRMFAANRDILLRRWQRCSDDRLYHPVLTELVLQMLGSRRAERAKKARQRALKASAQQGELAIDQTIDQAFEAEETDHDSLGTPSGLPGESQGSPLTGLVGKVGKGEIPSVSPSPPMATASQLLVAEAAPRPPAAAAGAGDDDAYRPPPTPTQAVIDLYHRHLPERPRIEVVNAARRRAIAARWREVCCDGKLTRERALEWFGWFFARVRESPFLMGKARGKDGTPFEGCCLDWLLEPTHFAKVVEGFYHRRKG